MRFAEVRCIEMLAGFSFYDRGRSVTSSLIKTQFAVLASLLVVGACSDGTGPEGGVLSPSYLLPSVSVGESHACGLASDGYAYCWGANDYGQLGNSSHGGYPEGDQYTPRRVTVNRRFVQISAGATHNCAVTADRETYCWGSNEHGQAGNPHYERIQVPLMIASDLEFHIVSARYSHTCGLTSDGKAYCWGYNHRGQLGVDTSIHSSSRPVSVGGDLRFRAIAAGGSHTCGITHSGDAYCWGGSMDLFLEPVRVVTDSLVFTEISAGVYYTCAISADMHAHCWFDDYQSTRPLSIGFPLINNTVGNGYGCSVTTDHDAYCWGDNYHGRLGTGDTEYRRVPALVTGGLQFNLVSTFDQTTCGVTLGGETYCWGWNYRGQVGNGSTEESWVPVKVNIP